MISDASMQLVSAWHDTSWIELTAITDSLDENGLSPDYRVISSESIIPLVTEGLC